MIRLYMVAHLIWAALCVSYGRAAQANPDLSPVSAIMTALRSQSFDEALRLCTAALEKSAKDKRIWALQGMAYSGKGASLSALNSFEHALKLDPIYLPALEGAAQVEYQRGNAAAKPLILRILAQHPTDPTSHTMLGYLDYVEKDCKDAVPHFALGGDVLATQPNALAAYATCLAELGRYDQAIPIFQEALKAEPTVASVRFNLALSQWKGNQPQEAIVTLQPLMGGSNGDDPLLLAADIYESANDTQHAVEVLRRAILQDPKNVEAYLDFASLSYDHASVQVGIDIINAGLTQLPQEARLYFVRGILYAQLGKFEESTEDFETADRLDPHLSLLGAAEGLEASQQHKSGEALSSFRAAARAHPKDALTQYLLAEAISQESPQEGSAEYAEETAAAKQAYKLDPSMVSAHDLLATIYLQDDLTELAIEQSKAALAVDPRDQQALYHLILAMRRTGQKDEISPLLKQLTVLRSSAQAEEVQHKRYQLQEMPADPPAQ